MSFPADYKGTPYTDEKYKGGAQKIPGTLYCAYVDLGGEGVAYHSLNKRNHGSGELNPIDPNDKPDVLYLHSFRHAETISTTYTKELADINPFNTITPKIGMLYIGWTAPGHWYNYTVEVAEAGAYTVDFLYTSNADFDKPAAERKPAQIALDVNGKPGVAVEVPTTNDGKDPVDWRHWHHWNLAKSLTEVKLEKGKNLITLHVVAGGQMNLGTLKFTLKK